MVWPIVYMFALAALCLLNVFIPRRMWGLFKSWRYKNPETVEPSDLVIAWYRFTGIVGAIMLSGIAIWLLLEMRRDATCDEVMAQLAERHAQGGVAAVEQRADELGMQVEDMTGSSIALPPDIRVTREGETVGILRTRTDDWTCEPLFFD